ncbi:MAG: hypothetical protein C0484_14945 [Rhodospirillum sp.]|nr:hypothetical protein [Rhodospirillum sp.]
MSAGLVGSSYADSSAWYPNGAYETGNSSNRYFKRGNVTCDRVRDVCYDRYGLSYHATARYLGEKEANRAVKKYGNQVFLFSPKRGVVCDRRTETCNNKRVANGNYGNSFNRTQARDGFGAIGSPSDWRYQQQQQQQQYWRYND